MMFIIGTVILVVCVFGGYLLEHGKLEVMFQPVEFLIIFGAATASFVIASPVYVVQAVIRSLPLILSFKTVGKEDYMQFLSLLYKLFTKIRKEGIVSIESDIESPDTSDIFRQYSYEPKIINFITDNLRLMISANISAMDLETLMEGEIEVLHEESVEASHAIARVADAMPGLGLVAAVLGVVLTMGKIDQPPAVIGHSIAVALLGTFLGIVMCYGYLGPIATNLEFKANEEKIYYQITKAALVASVHGAAPLVALEYGRRAIPERARPYFLEMESRLKEGGR